MNLSITRNHLTAVLLLLLICIAGIGCLYLFAAPDGWISVQKSHYTTTSPPPEETTIFLPTEQDYRQYPHLKTLLQNPGVHLPVSDNPLVRIKQGDAVVSGQEAGKLLGDYGIGKGYILFEGTYYHTMLLVT